LTMSETDKRLRKSERRIAVLQKGYEAILEFIDEMEALSQFQDKIDMPSDIEEIWKAFLDHIENLIKIEVCALFLADQDTHEFLLRGVSPDDKGPICQKELDFQIECGMFSWIINRRQPAVIPSLVFKNRKTIIMLPLSTIKKTLGVILVLTTIEESSITQENVKLLSMLAKQCSLVMENTLLYKDLSKEHESLLKAQDQILQAERLASIGRLTAGASHEILNPLNIISGHVQLLLMDEKLTPRYSKYLNIMRDQSDRISEIVKGLLQFSHHDRPKMEEVNVNDLVGRVLSLLEHGVGYDKIKIIKDLDDNIPTIMGDEKQLMQVLYNILSNAGDAMPSGGRLKISARASVDDSRLPAEGPGLIEIRVRDTGCGVSQENINKIFDPFFSTKEDGKWNGLGLSVSYGIIEEHGGTISVESEVDNGTVFIICLPAGTKESVIVKPQRQKGTKTLNL